MRKLIFFPEDHGAPRLAEAVNATVGHMKKGKDALLLVEGYIRPEAVQLLSKLECKAVSMEHPVLYELTALMAGAFALARIHGPPFPGDFPDARHMVEIMPKFPGAPSPIECFNAIADQMWDLPVKFSQEFLEYLEGGHQFLDSLPLSDAFRDLSAMQVIASNGGLPEIMTPEKLHEYLVADTKKPVIEFAIQTATALKALDWVREMFMAHSINEQTPEVGVINSGINHFNETIIDVLVKLGFREVDMEAFLWWEQ